MNENLYKLRVVPENSNSVLRVKMYFLIVLNFSTLCGMYKSNSHYTCLDKKKLNS